MLLKSFNVACRFIAARPEAPLSFNLIILSANFSGVKTPTWDERSRRHLPLAVLSKSDSYMVLFSTPWPFREIFLLFIVCRVANQPPENIFSTNYPEIKFASFNITRKRCKIEIKMLQRTWDAYKCIKIPGYSYRNYSKERIWHFDFWKLVSQKFILSHLIYVSGKRSILM